MHALTSGPHRLGRYQVIESLIAGPRWRSYRGANTESGQAVFLKTISKEVLESFGPAAVSRFKNDIRTATTLDHPGIVRVFEYDEAGQLGFVAMEYSKGWPLREQFRVSINDAVALTLQLLEALEHAHERGAIHRAIRAPKLLLTSKGLRITGFGTGSLDPGRPPYASPEQIMGLALDRRSDVFSAGVVFYELLTGTGPFPGPPHTLAERVCNTDERPPSEANPKLPTVFDAVCAKALAKGVNSRYATARDFHDAIRDAFHAAHGEHPSRIISHEAVLAVTCLGDNEKDSAPAAPAGPGPEAVSTAVDWDEATLQAVEKQLAVFLGPLARIIVKKAATKAANLDQLYSRAADTLQGEDDRKAFLATKGEVAASAIGTAATTREKSERARSSAAVAPASLLPPVAPAPAKPASVSGSVPAARSGTVPVAKPAPVPAAKAAAPAVGAEFKSEPPVAEPAPAPKPPLPTPAPAAKPLLPEPAAPIPTTTWDELLGKQPETLAGYLRERPPQIEEVIHAFVASVEAVAAAERENTKVGTLSPQSVLFDQFGKATIRTGDGASTSSSSARYAVPEIFAEKGSTTDSNTTASHMYALGFMFYEILLGKRLFEKTFAAQRKDLDWLRWHADLETKATPLSKLLPECPAAISDLVQSMMEKHADKRAADFQALLVTLRGVAQRANKTIVLRSPSAPSRRKMSVEQQPPTAKKKSAKGLLIGVIVVLAIAIVTLVLLMNPELYRGLLPH